MIRDAWKRLSVVSILSDVTEKSAQSPEKSPKKPSRFSLNPSSYFNSTAAGSQEEKDATTSKPSRFSFISTGLSMPFTTSTEKEDVDNLDKKANQRFSMAAYLPYNLGRRETDASKEPKDDHSTAVESTREISKAPISVLPEYMNGGANTPENNVQVLHSDMPNPVESSHLVVNNHLQENLDLDSLGISNSQERTPISHKSNHLEEAMPRESYESPRHLAKSQLPPLIIESNPDEKKTISMLNLSRYIPSALARGDTGRTSQNKKEENADMDKNQNSFNISQYVPSFRNSKKDVDPDIPPESLPSEEPNQFQRAIPSSNRGLRHSFSISQYVPSSFRSSKKENEPSHSKPMRTNARWTRSLSFSQFIPTTSKDNQADSNAAANRDISIAETEAKDISISDFMSNEDSVPKSSSRFGIGNMDLRMFQFRGNTESAPTASSAGFSLSNLVPSRMRQNAPSEDVATDTATPTIVENLNLRLPRSPGLVSQQLSEIPPTFEGLDKISNVGEESFNGRSDPTFDLNTSHSTNVSDYSAKPNYVSPFYEVSLSTVTIVAPVVSTVGIFSPEKVTATLFVSKMEPKPDTTKETIIVQDPIFSTLQRKGVLNLIENNTCQEAQVESEKLKLPAMDIDQTKSPIGGPLLPVSVNNDWITVRYDEASDHLGRRASEKVEKCGGLPDIEFQEGVYTVFFKIIIINNRLS
jgi:hypothetical protein